MIHGNDIEREEVLDLATETERGRMLMQIENQKVFIKQQFEHCNILDGKLSDSAKTVDALKKENAQLRAEIKSQTEHFARSMKIDSRAISVLSVALDIAIEHIKLFLTLKDCVDKESFAYRQIKPEQVTPALFRKKAEKFLGDEE